VKDVIAVHNLVVVDSEVVVVETNNVNHVKIVQAAVVVNLLESQVTVVVQREVLQERVLLLMSMTKVLSQAWHKGVKYMSLRLFVSTLMVAWYISAASSKQSIKIGDCLSNQIFLVCLLKKSNSVLQTNQLKSWI
jgi:hypothetical protein